MIDSLFEGPQFFIGKVEDVDVKTKIIKFSIPSVLDNLGEVENYPEAKPIGNQLTSIRKGDTVFIHKPNGYCNTIFFYQHFDITDFVGMKTSEDNYVQLIETDNHENDEIEIYSKKKVTIRNKDKVKIVLDGNTKVEVFCDDAHISLDKSTASPTAELKVGSSWTVKMPCSAIYSPFSVSICPVTGAKIGTKTLISPISD